MASSCLERLDAQWQRQKEELVSLALLAMLE